MANPLSLTVAVPTFNGARHIADTLKGILAQEAVPYQLLVCDDRSDDETLTIVRATAGDRARIQVNGERLGLAGNWNQCVELAGTCLVAIFHQDDLMGRGHLKDQLRAFDRYPGLGMACTAVDVIDDQGRAIPESAIDHGGLGAVDRHFATGAALPAFTTENPVRCSAVMISRDVHRRVGGFDAAYRYVVDWEFWLRVVAASELAWTARPSVSVRWHSGSETHRFKTGFDDLLEVEQLLEKALSLLDSAPADIETLRSAGRRKLARAYLNRSYEALRGTAPDRARDALRKAVRLSPSVLTRLAVDPRLAIQVAGLLTVPALTSRCLSRMARARSRGPAQPALSGSPSRSDSTFGDTTPP